MPWFAVVTLGAPETRIAADVPIGVIPPAQGLSTSPWLSVPAWLAVLVRGMSTVLQMRPSTARTWAAMHLEETTQERMSSCRGNLRPKLGKL